MEGPVPLTLQPDCSSSSCFITGGPRVLSFDLCQYSICALSASLSAFHCNRLPPLLCFLCLPGAAGDLQLPILRQPPPPVSPEAPESPPWKQQQEHQQHPLLPERPQVAPRATAGVAVENHEAFPVRFVLDAGAGPVPVQGPAQPPRQRQPVPATRPLSLRRRPCRPGSAEDTGSGAE